MDIPFDQPFSGYGAPATATDTTAASAANRAARIAKYGQSAVTAMETAGAAPPNMAAPNLVQPLTSAGGVSAASRVPAWLKTAGGFGAKFLGRAGMLGTAASVVMPGAELLKSGAEAAANAYASTGSNMSPNPTLGVVGTPAAAAPVGAVPTGDDQVAMGQKNLAAAMSPRFAQPATPDNNAVPPVGTGFIQNDQTGKTSYIDSRSSAPTAGATGGYGAGSLNPAAAFYGAGAHMRQIAQDNAQRNTGAKLLLDTIVKGSEARKNTALAEKDNFGVDVAMQHLRDNPGDYANAGAIANGRAASPKSVFLPTLDGSKVDVGDTRTGKVSRVTVPAKVNEADIQQTMKANNLTRAQVESRLKAEGRM